MESDKISVGKPVVHDGHREPALCGCEQKEVAHLNNLIRERILSFACSLAAQYAGTGSLATLNGGV